MTDEKVDCTRNHTIDCLQLHDQIHDIISTHKPTNFEFNPDPDLKTFNTLVDTIDAVSKHPSKPSSQEPPEAKQRWNARCEEIDKTVEGLWQQAGLIIDNICTCLLAWDRNHMYLQDEPLTVENNVID
jgi:hypothetical protein